MRSIRFGLSVAASVIAVVATAPAFAQSDSDRATARQLAVQGQDALAAKDYRRAEESFRRAEALFHAPTILLGLARAQAANGRFVEAWENYHRIVLEGVTSTPAFAKALDDARVEIAGVESRRARATVAVTGADAPKVFLDDVPIKSEGLGIERFVDPGDHVLRVSADGYKPVGRPFHVDEGKALNVSVVLEKDPAAAAAIVPAVTPGMGANVEPPPSTPESSTSDTHFGSVQKTLGLAVMGVGAAGLVVGGITGVLALGKHGDLANVCKPICEPSQQSNVDSYHTLAMVSTVGFIVGAVGAVGGAVLYLTAPKHAATPSAWVSPYVGPGSVGAFGRF